ncbi:MAG: hypothetical protein Kow00106_24030 [Anaerolineae bacterium]
MVFGFTIPYTDSVGNLRHHYPDFVVVMEDGAHYLLDRERCGEPPATPLSKMGRSAQSVLR